MDQLPRVPRHHGQTPLQIRGVQNSIDDKIITPLAQNRLQRLPIPRVPLQTFDSIRQRSESLAPVQRRYLIAVLDKILHNSPSQVPRPADHQCPHQCPFARPNGRFFLTDYLPKAIISQCIPVCPGSAGIGHSPIFLSDYRQS